MNKQYFIELAMYNVWANHKVCNWLEKISEEQWDHEIESSFKSIHATVLHIVGAEKAWLERFRNLPDIVSLTNTFTGSKEELLQLWNETSSQQKTFIDSFKQNELQANLDFKRFNGENFSMPYYQLFAHVFNHATYHRGQLVTMLRQVDFTNVESTDLSSFFLYK